MLCHCLRSLYPICFYLVVLSIGLTECTLAPLRLSSLLPRQAPNFVCQTQRLPHIHHLLPRQLHHFASDHEYLRILDGYWSKEEEVRIELGLSAPNGRFCCTVLGLFPGSTALFWGRYISNAADRERSGCECEYGGDRLLMASGFAGEGGPVNVNSQPVWAFGSRVRLENDFRWKEDAWHTFAPTIL